eukprot:CAMPEP_0184865372 /NCGR_PEP_ID=MMETSP0580-20130426/17866_1 /TAXON_ID=1118495 /ORGANISM="Dactyliosolen fragilissimus" /LENGTH=791 /DNA_ID=CAMNT_0027364541 /DNA_START=122 /DNA_END=2497 /DNA_ORIENTATION=-
MNEPRTKRARHQGIGGTNNSAKCLSNNINNKTSSLLVERDIPPSSHYQVSYAHRSVVTQVVHSPKHDMVVTASGDGIVKFWKRTPSNISGTSTNNNGDNANSTLTTTSGLNMSGWGCIEFVKSYVAHTSRVNSLVMAYDGDMVASVGSDRVIKFYDVGAFDVTGMIRNLNSSQKQGVSHTNYGDSIEDGLSFGLHATFLGEDQTLLAVSMGGDDGNQGGKIHVFSSVTLSPRPVAIISLHAAPITAFKYNHKHHCAISCDSKGLIEYWDGSTLRSDSGVDSNNINANNNHYDDEYDAMEHTPTTYANSDPDTNYDNLRIGGQPTSAKNGITYKSKLDQTDLLTLFKKRTHVVSLAISPTGAHFCAYSSDRKVYLYDFPTGKIIKRFDERMNIYDALVQKWQKTKQKEKSTERSALALSSSNSTIDSIDYGKRAATEREMAETTVLDKSLPSDTYQHQECMNQSLQITFDPTGTYILLPTVLGIKVIHWKNGKCSKIIAREDASGLRFLGGCLCLGNANVDKQMMLARTNGSNAPISSSSTATNNLNKDQQQNQQTPQYTSESILITMAYKKRRLYILTHFDPVAQAELEDEADPTTQHQNNILLSRDVLNEPPDAEDMLLHNGADGGVSNQDTKLGTQAILRTSVGDIHLRLFPEETPRTVENFCTHARNGYYDNVIFHRVIKGFMIQTGDPLGDGTGGESIWGGEFEDEFVRDLRHDRPFTLSMANAGPDTNGSQFFITTVNSAPWLDNKHTVFGRVTRGMDICSDIEATKVDDTDKPVDEISILSIDIL